MGVCRECGSDTIIVNKKYMLCLECNRGRRNASSTSADRQKSVKIRRNGLDNSRGKAGKEIKADNEFYKQIWDSREHYCEECGKFLGDDFADDAGRVLARFRYSHILPKGRYPQLRRDPRNINLMCLEHHDMWDNGDQEKMNVYRKNSEIISDMMKDVI